MAVTTASLMVNDGSSAAPQAAVGEQAGGAEHHDQEKNQSGMRNGPRRDIETAHRALPLTA
jgi:hypothetical protein